MADIIYIHEKLKNRVESFLINNNPNIEWGGFFLGKEMELIVVRFFPNKSNKPYNSYLTPNYWKEIIELDKKIFNLDFLVHFHTHPNHSFYSRQDLKVAHEKTYTEYNVLLAYDKSNNKYTWRCYDPNYEEHYIQVENKDYAIFRDYFSKTLDLMHLGDIYITQSGELLSTKNDFVKALITLDVDALNVLKYLKSKKGHFSSPTQKEIADNLDISTYVVRNAMKKLEENNLI